MRNKQLWKRGLSLGLAAAMTFTLLPNIGALVVKATPQTDVKSSEVYIADENKADFMYTGAKISIDKLNVYRIVGNKDSSENNETNDENITAGVTVTYTTADSEKSGLIDAQTVKIDDITDDAEGADLVTFAENATEFTDIVFTIGKASLADATVTLQSTSQTMQYTGDDISMNGTNVASVSIPNVTYTFNADDFTYSVTQPTGAVDGDNNGLTGTLTLTPASTISDYFSGTAAANFAVTPIALGNATVETLSETSYTIAELKSFLETSGNVKINGSAVNPNVYEVTVSANTDDETKLDYKIAPKTTSLLVTGEKSAEKATTLKTATTALTKTTGQAGTVEITGIDGVTKPYTGQPITLDNIVVTLKGADGTGTDTLSLATTSNPNGYTVEYADNTNAGTASVTIKGAGTYSGTITETFTIQPKSLSADNIKLVNATGGTTFDYTGDDITPTVQIIDGKDENDEDIVLWSGTESTASAISDSSKALNDCTVTIDATDYDNTNVTGAEGKDHGVKVTIAGSGNYALAATEKTFTITAHEIVAGDIENVNSGVAYKTGTTGTIYATTDFGSFTVKDAKETGTLTADNDYTATVTQPQSNAIGEDVMLTIAGTGNYSGTVNITKKIVGTDASSFAFTIKSAGNNKTFNGQQQLITKDDIEITDTTKGVTAEDFDILFGTTAADAKTALSAATATDFVNAGDIYIKLQYKGNFTGTSTDAVAQKYTIKPADLTDATVTLSGATGLTYTGNELTKPSVDSVYLKGVTAGDTGAVNYASLVTATVYPSTKTVSSGEISGTGDAVTTLKDAGDYVVIVSGTVAANFATNKVAASNPFTVAKKELTASAISLDATDGKYTYSTKEPAPKVTITDGETKVFEGTASNDVITLVNNADKTAGQKTLTVKFADAANYIFKDAAAGVENIAIASNTATVPFTVEKYDIENADVTIPARQIGATVTLPTIADLTFTSDVSEIQTEMATEKTSGTWTVEIYEGNQVSAETLPSDKKVTSAFTTAGTYTAVIKTGNSTNYTGELRKAFTVLKSDSDIMELVTGTPSTGQVQVKIEVAEATFTGKALMPDVTVKVKAVGEGVTGVNVDDVLTKADSADSITGDFYVTYADNLNASTGTAKVTVTGINDYKTTAGLEAKFDILPKTLTASNVKITDTAEKVAASISSEVTSYEYTGSAIFPYVQIVDTIDGKETILFKGTGAAQAGVDGETIAGNSGITKIKVTTAATAGGTTDNTTVAKGGSIDITLADGNYKFADDKVTKTFTITPKEIAADNVELAYTTTEYTGSQLKPTVTIKKDGSSNYFTGTETGAFTSDADTTVTLTYGANKNAAANGGTVNIKVAGNYKLEGDSGDGIDKTFTISPKTINVSNVTLEYATHEYTGSQLKPKVVITDGDVCFNANANGAFKNDENTSVALTYGDNLNVADGGSVTVVVSGNYVLSAECEKTFTITQKEIQAAWVKDISDQPLGATGKAEPTVTITDSDRNADLEADVDFTVAYENNTAAGTATAKITGKGNYKTKADIEKTFTIIAVTVKDTSEDEPVTATDGKGLDALASGTVSIAVDVSDDETVEDVEQVLYESIEAGLNDTEKTALQAAQTNGDTITIEPEIKEATATDKAKATTLASSLSGTSGSTQTAASVAATFEVDLVVYATNASGAKTEIGEISATTAKISITIPITDATYTLLTTADSGFTIQAPRAYHDALGTEPVPVKLDASEGAGKYKAVIESDKFSPFTILKVQTKTVQTGGTTGGNSSGGGTTMTTENDLISVAKPESISVDNGTSLADIVKQLPATVKLTVGAKNNKTTTVDGTVKWNETPVPTYDATKTDAQTLTFTGEVTLPTGITNTKKVATSVTVTVEVAKKGEDVKPDDTTPDNTPTTPAKGETVTTTDATGAKAGVYTVTDASKKTVSFDATSTTGKKVTIPATVTGADGTKYKVTSIKANALKGNKKITTVVIGKNVTKIGKKAFYNCKNLKTITMQGGKVTSIGKNAFKGIAKKATIKVKGTVKQVKKITKLIQKSGVAKTVKIKRAK